MVSTRHSRPDVVKAAGRLFADRGYHGTSMRDLGKELGLLGSSLYAHVESKQDLLVEVVEAGARLFEESADRALSGDGDAAERLRRLVVGHVDVVLENIDVARVYLNEAKVLDEEHRVKVLTERDRYEKVFRRVIDEGVASGVFRQDVDAKASAIFILSILNSLDRWYRLDGALGREDLVTAIAEFATRGIGAVDRP